MRAPDFWWSARPGLFGRIMIAILTPLAALYGRAACAQHGAARLAHQRARDLHRQFRRRAAPARLPPPSGSANWLQRAGETPYFLSRGYGGALSADGGAHLVDQRRHGAAQAGDEPLLLARVAQTVVARDRPTGAMLALAGGASLIVMDDGLQNPSLRRDFALAVIDGAVGFGNGRLIPAGPLRAPIENQLRLSSAALVIGEGEAGKGRRRFVRGRRQAGLSRAPGARRQRRLAHARRPCGRLRRHRAASQIFRFARSLRRASGRAPRFP